MVAMVEGRVLCVVEVVLLLRCTDSVVFPPSFTVFATLLSIPRPGVITTSSIELPPSPSMPNSSVDVEKYDVDVKSSGVTVLSVLKVDVLGRETLVVVADVVVAVAVVVAVVVVVRGGVVVVGGGVVVVVVVVVVGGLEVVVVVVVGVVVVILLVVVVVVVVVVGSVAAAGSVYLLLYSSIRFNTMSVLQRCSHSCFVRKLFLLPSQPP